MRIYLDEDTASGLLVQLLRNAGHDVSNSVDDGMNGKSDAVQLGHSIREQRACLSRNVKDFEELHLLIQDATGKHAGILIVCRENDPTRDLTPRGIINAIRKLEAAAVPVENEYIVLNHWR